MTDNKMYSQRASNIAFHRGCGDENGKWCDYCAFERLIQMNKKCPDCMVYKPHTHPEVLNKKPPKTKLGEFVTFSLAGEVSFMNQVDFALTWRYMKKYPETTFLIQAKSPSCFLKWQDVIPDNCIVGTTIESNKRDFTPLLYHTEFPHYDYISAAPYPDERYEAMLKLNCRTAITIEPILDFDIDILEKWILSKHWDFVYIGYANDKKEGKRLRLPEPELQKVYALIDRLKRNCYGTEIRIKTLRPAWYEEI